MNTTLVTYAVPASARGNLVLVIFDPVCPRTVLLPSDGACTIGRATEADIAVDDGEASRIHAQLRIEPESAPDAAPAIVLTDNRSRNGTFLAGRRLASGASARLTLGETFQIGGTILMVQREQSVPRPHRLFSHAYLVARLDEACSRMSDLEERDTTLVARFSLRNQDAEDAKHAEDRFIAISREVLRPFDLLARRGPREFVVLICDCPSGEAEALVMGLAEVARARAVALQVAVAVLPRDGRSTFALLDAAEARLRPDNGAHEIDDVAMDDVMVRLQRAAGGTSAVLLLGETGTGKSYMAERIHAWSPRGARPFVVCDCAALSSELIDSELFGHARGAFTGATAARAGLVESADGGTLFLDEIGELPIEQQVKLLTVLDAKRVRRVGENQARAVDFRLLAATSQDLRALVRAGRFRPELYYRLNVIRVSIPPLRERPAAIVALAERFLADANAAAGRRVRFAPASLDLLRAHPWPGNIRELRNAIERAVAMAEGEVLQASDFDLEDSITITATEPNRAQSPATKWQAADVTREELVRALVENGGNRTRTGKALGRSREWLRQRCIELGIPLGR